MNLQEKLDRALNNVDKILSERQRLLEKIIGIQKELDENSNDFGIAVKERDSVKAMLSVIPPPKRVNTGKPHMEEKRAVFSAIRQIPDTWIAPQGLAVLSGVDDETTAAILRRAAAVELIPIEHNGKRGRGSMYRWVGWAG